MFQLIITAVVWKITTYKPGSVKWCSINQGPILIIDCHKSLLNPQSESMCGHIWWGRSYEEAVCFVGTNSQSGYAPAPVSYTHLDVYKRQERER